MNAVIPNRLKVHVCPTRTAAGTAAAAQFHEWVEEVLREKAKCRVIFACAPSQDEFFAALVAVARQKPGVWERVEVFHMDDYVGLAGTAPQSFRAYLHHHFLDHVHPAAFHPICAETEPPAAEAKRYAALLAEAPIDVIAMGVGENGHIAFNDPPVADFADPVLAKVVELDEVCRQQQVNDGCFPELADVPRYAITLTLPVFARAGRLCCTVPGIRKAKAVHGMLLDPIGPGCPATLLRLHPQAALFIDEEAASLLPAGARS